MSKKVTMDNQYSMEEVVTLVATIDDINMTDRTAAVTYRDNCHVDLGIDPDTELEFHYNCQNDIDRDFSAFKPGEKVYVLHYYDKTLKQMQTKIFGHYDKKITPLCCDAHLVAKGQDTTNGHWEDELMDCAAVDPALKDYNYKYVNNIRYIHQGEEIILTWYGRTTTVYEYQGVIVQRGSSSTVFNLDITANMMAFQMSAALSSDFNTLYVCISHFYSVGAAYYFKYTWDKVTGTWTNVFYNKQIMSGVPGRHRFVDRNGHIWGSGSATLGSPDYSDSIDESACPSIPYVNRDVTQYPTSFSSPVFDIDTESWLSGVNKRSAGVMMSPSSGDAILAELADISKNPYTHFWRDWRATEKGSSSTSYEWTDEEEMNYDQRDYGSMELYGPNGSKIGTMLNGSCDVRKWHATCDHKTEALDPPEAWWGYTRGPASISGSYIYETHQNSLTVTACGFVIETGSKAWESLDSGYQSPVFYYSGLGGMQCNPPSAAIGWTTTSGSDSWERMIYPLSMNWSGTHAISHQFSSLDTETGEWWYGLRYTSDGSTYNWKVLRNGGDVTAHVQNCLRYDIDDMQAIYFRMI